MPRTRVRKSSLHLQLESRYQGGVVNLPQQLRQTRSIEDLGRGVSHLFHGQMNTAYGLVAAVAARDIRGLAGAGHRRQRTIEHPHDLAQIDGARITRQQIPATLPFPAPQNALIPELEQDQLEEL